LLVTLTKQDLQQLWLQTNNKHKNNNNNKASIKQQQQNRSLAPEELTIGELLQQLSQANL
jgi:hypothetical protein